MTLAILHIMYMYIARAKAMRVGSKKVNNNEWVKKIKMKKNEEETVSSCPN